MYQQELLNMMTKTKKYKDWTNERINNITIISFAGKENNHLYWNAVCSCGNTFKTRSDQIKTVKSCGCLNKLENGKAATNKVYKHYKKSAVSRGYVFDLDIDTFTTIITKPCYYCGSSSMQTRKTDRMNGEFLYTGLDRVDNSKGYTSDNVVPCCGFCNRAKFNKTIEEFEAWIHRLVKYRTI